MLYVVKMIFGMQLFNSVLERCLPHKIVGEIQLSGFSVNIKKIRNVMVKNMNVVDIVLLNIVFYIGCGFLTGHYVNVIVISHSVCPRPAALRFRAGAGESGKSGI